MRLKIYSEYVDKSGSSDGIQGRTLKKGHNSITYVAYLISLNYCEIAYVVPIYKGSRIDIENYR